MGKKEIEKLEKDKFVLEKKVEKIQKELDTLTKKEMTKEFMELRSKVEKFNAKYDKSFQEYWDELEKEEEKKQVESSGTYY